MKHKGIWHSCGEKIFEDEREQECSGCGKTWSKVADSTADNKTHKKEGTV